MPEITLTIDHEVGLHARAAAMLVEEARQFESRIELLHGERVANGRSILSILSLGASQGATVTLRATGADADEALATLQALIASNFREDE
jgi:phosphocarrier protein HPr